ncbi:MAG: thioesterase family protein [Candidatus Gastranaerophilaceae bacterium]|jgi:acyl-CoA thioester hydrolase
MGLKHINRVKIYHVDTDSYGIVWHGSYIRWFEVGRVEIANQTCCGIKEMEDAGILLPVVELSCRYKSPARLLDEIIIETEISAITKTSITFKHTITNETTSRLVLTASTTCVTTDKNGKLFRKIPDEIYKKFETV